MKPFIQTSPTGYNNFRGCTLKWYLNHEGYEREESEKGHAYCGTAVHEAVEKVITTGSVDHEHNLSHVPIDKHGNTVDLRDYDGMVDKYHRCYRMFEEMGLSFVNPKVEEEMFTMVDGIKVRGFIDIIDENAIWDIKTGSPKQEDDIQGAFYRRICRDNGIDLPAKFIYLKEGFIKDIPEYPDDFVDSAIASMKDVIERLAFHPNVGKACLWCEFNDECKRIRSSKP